MLASGLHPAQCRTEIAQGTGRRPPCCGTRLDQDSQRRPAGPGLIVPPGQDPRPPRPGRPRCHAQRRNAGTAGQLLLRPPGARAPGLLHLAGSPAPEPGRGRRVGHRPAHRLAPGTGRRPACRNPGGRIPHRARLHLPARGCRRQRRARAHRRPHPRRKPRRCPRAATASPALRHPERRPEPLGPQHDPDGDPVLRGPAGRLRSCPADLHQDRRLPRPARRCPSPRALGAEEHPGLPAPGLVRPSLHADRRRQRPVHPADSSAPARPDGRRRLPQRCRPVPGNRISRHRLARLRHLHRSRPRPLRGQEAVRSPQLRERTGSPRHASSTTRQRHWSITRPGDEPSGPGASTRKPGRASPPGCRPLPARSSPISGTGNASSPPSTSGSRSPLASTSSPRGLSRPSCPPASGSPGPSGQAHGNYWTPANSHPGPHYTSLKAELATIATPLARTIDNRC